jgi:hypothetical protein
MASLLILEQHEDATAGLSLIKLFASVESLSGVLAASYHTYFKNKTVGNSTTKQFCTESNISIGTFMDILNDLRENQYTMMGTNAYMNGAKVVKTFYLEKYRGSNAYSSSIVSDAQKRSSLANAYRKSISDNYIRSATNEAPAVSNDVAQTKSPPPPPLASKVSSIFGGSQNESNNSTADAAPSRSRSIISSRMASLAQMRSSRAEKSPSTDTKTKKSSVATLFGIFSSAQDDTEYKDDVFVEDKAEVVVSSSAPTIKRPPSQKTFVPDTIAEENDEADTSQKYNNSYTPTINVVEAPKYSPPPPPVPPKPATPAATTNSNNYNDIVNSSSAPKVSTPNYSTTSATTPTSTPNVRGSVANAYLQATAKHTPVTTPVSAESEAMKQKNAEYFRAKREEEEEKKRQKAAEEEKMDPDQLARMKAEEAEKAGHDASKTAHYSRLGSAFVATRGTNLLAGGRGGAGRGPGVRKI